MSSVKCVGHTKAGLPCKAFPIAGGTVCLAHGGRAPQVKAAAQKRLAKVALEGEVGRLLTEMGQDPVPDLIDGLLIAVEHCARMVAAYRIVAAGRDALGRNRFGEEVPDVGVVEYRHWLDEWAKLTKLALDAGIDERRTRITEAASGALFGCVGRALEATGLSLDQQAAFRAALAAELRGLDGAA